MSAQNSTGPLRPRELEALYAISRAVAKAIEVEAALDEVTRLARTVFIFDSIVLYEQRPSAGLEPTFARAIGRGRFLEAELTWGEYVANDAYNTGKTVIREEQIPDEENGSKSERIDRTSIRFFLGFPLTLGDQVVGALVFVRFGGPIYTQDQINLAEFIALHVAQLLGYRQLVERVANLEARRRLDEMQDDFIATISHELLTPLGFIKGYATTLLREDIDWDQNDRREFLNIIDEESDRLRELIDNLMDSSRLQAGTLRMSFQPVRLDTLLRDISLRAKTRHEPLNINLELGVTGLQIEADPTRLAQVFENLLNNAYKYASGSSVTIKLDQEDENTLLVQFIDEGPGIAPEHIDHVFKRFYRVPDQTTSIRGSGLGLYICRQIIQAHQGHIHVSSEYGKGTTFSIRLPIERQHVVDTSIFEEGIHE